MYQWNFVRNLKSRMRRKVRRWPGRFDLGALGGIRTVRAFDDEYTARFWGFRDASDYYHRASALRVADRIRTPALVIVAEDDPFVPTAPFHEPALARNPHVRLVVTRHGGHCAFVGDPVGPGDDGYWAERAIVAFASEVTTGRLSAAARTPVPSPALRA